LQVNAIESANINAETLVAMRQGAQALKSIHQGLCVLASRQAQPPYLPPLHLAVIIC
jgi:hypothetical protein